MNIKIDLGIWGSIFCVPCAVIDNYLKIAGGSDIKLLIFLLRHSGESLDSKVIAERLALSEEQIEESAEFWKEKGIIASELNAAVSNALNKADEAAILKKHTEPQINSLKPISESLVHKINLERTPDFLPIEIARTVKSDERANYLFKHCEMLYGRPLKHNEQQTLMIILEDACLSVEAALILVDYCFSVNKATPAYMRAMAAEWASSEISTIEKAEKRVEELKRADSAAGRFKKLFELTSAFSKQQKEMIEKWVNVYGFQDDMINEAYQKTLNGTGKLSFPYMDKILISWHEKGIKMKEQIESDKKPQTSVKEKNSSLDIKKVEQRLLDKYKKSGGSI